MSNIFTPRMGHHHNFTRDQYIIYNINIYIYYIYNYMVKKFVALNEVLICKWMNLMTKADTWLGGIGLSVHVSAGLIIAFHTQ